MEKEFTERLEILLNDKSFNVLDKQEKEYVLTFLNEEEYYTCVELLKGAKANYKDKKDTLIIPDHNLVKLREAYKKKYNPKHQRTMAIPFTKFQLPYYQIAAAILIVGVSFYSIESIVSHNISEEAFSISDKEFKEYTEFEGEDIESFDYRLQDELTLELLKVEMQN